MLAPPWLLLLGLALAAVACMALGVYLVTEARRAAQEEHPDG